MKVTVGYTIYQEQEVEVDDKFLPILEDTCPLDLEGEFIKALRPFVPLDAEWHCVRGGEDGEDYIFEW